MQATVEELQIINGALLNSRLDIYNRLRKTKDKRQYKILYNLLEDIRKVEKKTHGLWFDEAEKTAKNKPIGRERNE